MIRAATDQAPSTSKARPRTPCRTPERFGASEQTRPPRALPRSSAPTPPCTLRWVCRKRAAVVGVDAGIGREPLDGKIGRDEAVKAVLQPKTCARLLEDLHRARVVLLADGALLCFG